MIDVILLVLLLGAAVGAGSLPLGYLRSQGRREDEEVIFSLALGLGMLILGVLLLGLVRGLHVPAVIGLVVCWGGLGLRQLLRVAPLRRAICKPTFRYRSFEFWFALLAILGVLFQLFRALAPPHGATDPLAYQLALPKLYLVKHFLSFEATLTGALYPSNSGLLYLVGLALHGGSLAQLLHWSMGVATCASIYLFTRETFSRETAMWGAGVFSFLPVVVVFSPQGYVDATLCFFQFVAFWALWNWMRSGALPELALAAALTGLAMGVKHQGMATALVGFGVIALVHVVRRRDWSAAIRDCAVYGIIALLLVSPWYLRAWVEAGNPIWPLANDIFDGIPFAASPTVRSGAPPDAALGLGGLIPGADWFSRYARSMNPWNWTFSPDGFQKSIGVYYVALLPGIMLCLRDIKVRQLLGFCLFYYVVLIRLLHMNPRYGLVLFAVASVLVGISVARLLNRRSRSLRVVLGCGLLLSASLNAVWSFAMARPLLAVASGGESEVSFLSRTEPAYRVFRYANESTQASSRILLQGMVKGYYCEREYLWDHPHQNIIRYSEFDTPEALLSRMRELQITHVARMINIPKGRRDLGYPQYFTDPFHEAFRHRYLRLLYRDESYAFFEVAYAADQDS